jgi:hypothetical protein
VPRGFNLTTAGVNGTAGGDLDIFTKAVDSDTIIRDAIVLVVRTRRGEWYYNPQVGLDPETANISTRDQDIRATLEDDLRGDLSLISGFTLDNLTVSRVGATRNWRVIITGHTVRPLTVDMVVEV